MKRRRIRQILGVLFTALAVYLAALAVSIVRYAGVDETRDADAIIVLGAAAAEDGPSPVFRARLDHAVALYREGRAARILLTGGMGRGNTRSDAAIARDYVCAQGVPREAVLLEERSTITEENLRNAKALMDAEGLQTALLVSDPLHMRRAMEMARDLGIAAYSSPTRTSIYRTLRTRAPFLLRELFFYTGYRWTRPLRAIIKGIK